MPVAINGVAMSLVELITSLETIAGAHGVGRIDMVENRLGRHQVARDLRSAGGRGAARRAQASCSGSSRRATSTRLASELGVQYADLVYNGLWYSPTREAIDAFVAKVQERVTGTIRLKLFKGDCRVVGRQSPFALPTLRRRRRARCSPATQQAASALKS